MVTNVRALRALVSAAVAVLLAGMLGLGAKLAIGDEAGSPTKASSAVADLFRSEPEPAGPSEHSESSESSPPAPEPPAETVEPPVVNRGTATATSGANGRAKAVGNRNTTVVDAGGAGVSITNVGSATASSGGNAAPPGSSVSSGPATAVGNESTTEIRSP